MPGGSRDQRLSALTQSLGVYDLLRPCPFILARAAPLQDDARRVTLPVVNVNSLRSSLSQPFGHGSAGLELESGGIPVILQTSGMLGRVGFVIYVLDL